MLRCLLFKLVLARSSQTSQAVTLKITTPTSQDPSLQGCRVCSTEAELGCFINFSAGEKLCTGFGHAAFQVKQAIFTL